MYVLGCCFVSVFGHCFGICCCFSTLFSVLLQTFISILLILFSLYPSYLVVHSLVFVSLTFVCVCMVFKCTSRSYFKYSQRLHIIPNIQCCWKGLSVFLSLSLSFSGLPNCRINYFLMAISKRWVLFFLLLLINKVGWSVGRSLRYFLVAKCKCGAEAKKIIRPAIVVIVSFSTAQTEMVQNEMEYNSVGVECTRFFCFVVEKMIWAHNFGHLLDAFSYIFHRNVLFHVRAGPHKIA